MIDDRTAVMSARALSPGYEILWYTIERVLGQGGFGITYLAHDRNLDRSVAIKEYLPNSFAYRREDYSVKPISGEHRESFVWGLDSFQKEAQTLARFNHPNIVRVNSVFEANNTAYMVMEYEHGQSLASVYKQNDKRKKQSFFEQVFFPIFDGLKEIHKTNFIHRDIKPANIFIRNDGTPVLIDFGSARQSSQQQSSEMTSLISQGYTPLEQYSVSYGEQGPWTDVYALAATIYEGIVGDKPDESLSRSACLMRAKPDLVKPLSVQQYPAFTQPFLDAVYSGLKLEPENRPQSIEQWSDQFNTGITQGKNLLTGSDFTALQSNQIRLKPTHLSNEVKNETLGYSPNHQVHVQSNHQPIDRLPDDEILNFDDVPDLNSDLAIRTAANTTSKRYRRRNSKGRALMLFSVAILTLLSIGAGYMYYTTSSSGTDMSVATLNKMPRPRQAITTILPRDSALSQLDHMANMAELLKQAYSINNTDAELLDTIQQTESSLLSMAKTWNATRFSDISEKIEAVSIAMPAEVHNHNSVKRILSASDQLVTYEQIIAFLDAKSYLRPSGSSVIDSISSVNTNDYQRIRRTAQWQQMMSELSQSAMDKLAQSEFDDVAKLTEAALSLDADHQGFNTLKQFLAGS